MPIKLQPGHWYERKDGEIVKYDRPNGRIGRTHFPHIVGGHSYTDRGRYMAGRDPCSWDLMKDLGTTGPRHPKKRVKKSRKVKMYFYRNTGHWEVSEDKEFAKRHHYPEHGRVFPQIINFPIQKPKKSHEH